LTIKDVPFLVLVPRNTEIPKPGTVLRGTVLRAPFSPGTVLAYAYRTEAAYLKATGDLGGRVVTIRNLEGQPVPLTRETANIAAEDSVRNWVDTRAEQARVSNQQIDRKYDAYVRKVAENNKKYGLNQAPTPKQKYFPVPVYTPPPSY